MGRIDKAVKSKRSDVRTKRVNNFMGGNSYEINAIDTLKMITASSIFGEPSYYRNGEFNEAKIFDDIYNVDTLIAKFSILDDSKYKGLTTSQIMELVIDNALDEDFEATINWAIELRQKYLMRLNPQVIMVRAAIHPKRIQFNLQNPAKFREAQKLVMSRADEPASQFAYYLYKKGDKKKLPSILKRSWADKLNSLNRYQLAKYKNAGVGIINTVRVSHAHSPNLDELLRTNNINVADEDKTWEVLRSKSMSWKEILNTIDMPHMALLRSLRGIFSELTEDDRELAISILSKLEHGVLNGKQFPFRYYVAYKHIENDFNVNFKSIILDSLERCMDISLENMPKLHGKTICLSDNSGSAWGAIPSEYGSVRVAEIGNLSAVITAYLSDEGYVGVFGDELRIIPIKKRDGLLSQMKEVTSLGRKVGESTENGIWLFFNNAILNKEYWDNIFIYSDMQAGHGGLYGTDSEMIKYEKAGYACRKDSRKYIDVFKLIRTYRQEVFNETNIFSIQTAGYTNVAIPEYAYRTNIMYGWTGKEVVFADFMINFWNSLMKF